MQNLLENLSGGKSNSTFLFKKAWIFVVTSHIFHLQTLSTVFVLHTRLIFFYGLNSSQLTKYCPINLLTPWKLLLFIELIRKCFVFTEKKILFVFQNIVLFDFNDNQVISHEYWHLKSFVGKKSLSRNHLAKNIVTIVRYKLDGYFVWSPNQSELCKAVEYLIKM